MFYELKDHSANDAQKTNKKSLTMTLMLPPSWTLALILWLLSWSQKQTKQTNNNNKRKIQTPRSMKKPKDCMDRITSDCCSLSEHACLCPVVLHPGWTRDEHEQNTDNLFVLRKESKFEDCAEVHPSATVATSSSASNEINIETLTVLRLLVRRTEIHPKFSVKSLPGE